MTAAADALALYEKARAQANGSLNRALDTLDAAFRLYGSTRIVVAFNGGKDATVVLHLARASLAHWARLDNVTPVPRLNVLYLPPTNDTSEFDELQQFVHDTCATYELSEHEVRGGFKAAIDKFRGDRDLLAFVMGTRRADPHGATLEHFSPSSPGWPPFMRVNPILEWHYDDVWRFLRGLDIPYCVLYDHGYTSIGSVENTAPNPALRKDDGTYRPAWQLLDGSLERAGRTRPPDNVVQPQVKEQKEYISGSWAASVVLSFFIHTNYLALRSLGLVADNHLETPLTFFRTDRDGMFTVDASSHERVETLSCVGQRTQPFDETLSMVRFRTFWTVASHVRHGIIEAVSIANTALDFGICQRTLFRRCR